MGIVFGKSKKTDCKGDLPEDTRLAFEASKGDMKAFEALVLKYERLVSTCVYGVVSNTEDAMDVSQEVFLKVYNNISKFKGDSEFSTWLYRVAKNCAYDFVRKKKHQTLSLDTSGEEGEGFDLPDNDISSNPEKKFLQDEKTRLLRSCIDKLSKEHREVIILRDINNYSYDKISELLNIEQGTVKSRISRARDSLRKILEKENYF